MLQWMGGSRRKVTTTRKSTQQRQKQYFEQRKRQQQHHTAGRDNNTDRASTSGQDNKEQRSLDVLSLLNLSSVVQEHSTSSPYVNNQVKKGLPTVLTDEVTPADYAEFNERAPSRYQVEILSPKSDADRHSKTFSGKIGKPDNSKAATGHQLSVLDLLGDDGPSSNLDRSPRYEAHVAFAIEGLGKVGTETPVHSPRQPHRISSFDCSLPLKDAKRLHSSKNVNSVLDNIEEVDTIMQDISLLPSDSSLKLPYPMSIGDPFGNSKQRVSTFGDFMQDSGHSRKIRNSFGDEENFYEFKDKNENIWDVSACSAEYYSPDDRKCDPFWKHLSGEEDGNFADFLKVGNRELSDLTFKSPWISKKRNATEARNRLNVSDLSTPYLGHQTSENDHDFATSDGTRSPMLGRIWEFTDITSQPNWPLFATEDATESVSLLSEESCSSSAVRGEATYSPQLNSLARKNMRRRGKGFCMNEYSSKNRHANETWYKNGNDAKPRFDDIYVSREFTRASNLSSSKESYQPNSAGNVGPLKRWSFEDVRASVDINPDLSCVFRTSETEEDGSSGSKFWSDDLSGEFPVPELHISAKTLYGQSKSSFPGEYSPPCSSFSGKPVFCKPSNRAHTCSYPIFGDIGARLDEQDLSLKMDGKSPDSLHIGGSLEDVDCPSILVQENFSKYQEHASIIQPTDCQNFGLRKESCHWNNGLSSELITEASDLKDNCSGCQESEDGNPEKVATDSSRNAEEPSSSEVKITDKLNGRDEGKTGCHHDIQSPHALLNRNAETEDEGSEDRQVTRSEQNKCLETIEPAAGGHVMKLESYVLQLLCVQKVIKEACAEDSQKAVLGLGI